MQHKPVTDKVKRYYYHVTNLNDWGEEKIIYPRDNEESAGRGWYEPDFSKICVCPSIPMCLTAFEVSLCQYFVYRTEKKIRAILPWEVSDKKITKEKWIDKPTKFVFIGRINHKIVDALECELGNTYFGFGGNRSELRGQMRYKRFVLRQFNKFGLGVRKMPKKCKAIIKKNIPKQKSRTV